jgi:predicted ATP-binding protein involved in virulence
MRLTSIRVAKLFETFDYSFGLNVEERVTLLYGPNGYGKTTILRLIEALSKGNLGLIRNTPFQSVTLTFDNDSELNVVKSGATDGTPHSQCTFEIRLNKAPQDIKIWTFDPAKPSTTTVIQQRFPQLRQIDVEMWEDMSDGEILSTAEIGRRFGLDADPETNSEISKWLRHALSAVNVRFIEAQRLMRSAPVMPTQRRINRTSSMEFTSVSNYSRQLASRIQGLLGEYAERSQRLDQSFPTRLLETFQAESETTISDQDLANRLSELDKKRSRLREAGLLEKEDQIAELPTAVKPEVKRVLSVYLNDVTQKLGVFDSTLNRIELMREILDEHFSFKRLVISREHGLQFQTPTGKKLPASSLSSGEQHMLILIYELLFQEDRDSLLLIDEPEISLHISWQLSFLSDLERIAKINQNDVLIATHSPQIIGDRTDLTVDLLEDSEEALR